MQEDFAQRLLRTRAKTRAYNIVMEKERRERAAALARLGAKVKYGENAPGAFGNACAVRETVYPKDGMALARTVAFLRGEAIVVGGATDVLFPDGNFERTVISVSRAKDVTFNGERVYCCAGARLPDVVSKCAKRALSGFEQLSGIPGSVGGAVKMNAGAFGREIAELITRVDAATADGRIVALSPYALNAGYRRTDVEKKGLTVLGAEFALVSSTEREIRESVAEYAERRRLSQPEGRSLGSVFKRADGVSAGYYIERVGLKGEKKGGAEISVKHANFIINKGGATGADFLFLAELAKQRVFGKFGITLEYEVVFL